MTLAWKSGLPAGRKMVLLALCDNANDQGECFPSVPMLATKCSMGERTVQQHIADMEVLGIVTREMRNGRSTIYHIDPRKFCAPAETAPPQISHPTPAESAPPPPQISHHTPADFAPITTNEPSIEPSGNRHKRAKAAPDGFDPLAALLQAGVGEQIAKDWLQLRKKKRADVSLTVLQEHVKQAGIAGLSLEDALRMSCLRGWQGFDASFLKPAQARASPQPYESAKDRSRREASENLTGRKNDRRHDIIDIN